MQKKIEIFDTKVPVTFNVTFKEVSSPDTMIYTPVIYHSYIIEYSIGKPREGCNLLSSLSAGTELTAEVYSKPHCDGYCATLSLTGPSSIKPTLVSSTYPVTFEPINEPRYVGIKFSVFKDQVIEFKAPAV